MTLPTGTWIGLGTNIVTYSWQVLEGPIRNDVPGAISFALGSTKGVLPTELWIRQVNGEISHSPLTNFREGAVHALPDVQGGLVGVDLLSYNSKRRTADVLIGPMSKVWSWFGWTLIPVGFLSFLFFCGRDVTKLSVISVVATLMLVAMLTRIFLLALLDSSSWSGQQTRYLLPALPFFAVFGILGVWSAQQWLMRTQRRFDVFNRADSL